MENEKHEIVNDSKDKITYGKRDLKEIIGEIVREQFLTSINNT